MTSRPEEDLANILFLSVLLGGALFILALAIVFSPVWGSFLIAIIWAYRHFTSPQMQEKKVRKDFEALYDQARSRTSTDPKAFRARLENSFGNAMIVDAGMALYALEGFERPPPPPPICNSIEGARYKDRLLQFLSKADDPVRANRFQDELVGLLPHAPDIHGPFIAIEQFSNEQIGSLADRFFSSDEFFKKLQLQLTHNLRDQKSVFPEDYQGDNAAYAYLKGTPLLPLAERTVGVKLEKRTHHTHIVAGSGWGKTTLLEYMIEQDLEDDCCVVVLDNQRQIIPALARRDVEDAVYLSPSHALGINLFDVGYASLRQERDGEQAINAIVELLEYVLGALMDAELTSKQQIVFQYAIQLAIAVPNPGIRELLNILNSKSLTDYEESIDTLPSTVQEFLRTEFGHDQFTSTKKEIGWRIWSMLKNPTLARIFSAPSNPVDMYRLLETKKLVLIDSDINLLSERGSSLFGRMFIAFMLQAARRRFQGKHRRVYFYIDEAPIYFDRNLATMLEQARKADIGIILAHQELEQARNRGLLSSLQGNTATKFAGGLSDADARSMASNMRVTAEFIKDQQPHHFALSMQGAGAFSVTIPKPAGGSERYDFDAFVQAMEQQYGYDATVAAEAPQVDEPERPPPQEEPTRQEPPKQEPPAPNTAPGDW